MKITFSVLGRLLGAALVLAFNPSATQAQFVGPTVIIIDGIYTDWGTTNSPAAGVYLIQDASNTGVDDANGGFAGTSGDLNYVWQAFSTLNGGTDPASPSNPIQYVYYRVDTFESGASFGNAQPFWVQMNLGNAPVGYGDYILQFYVDPGQSAPSNQVKIVLYSYATNYPAMKAFTDGTITKQVGSMSDYGNAPPPVRDTNATGQVKKNGNTWSFEAKVPIAWFGATYGGKVKADGTGANAVRGANFTSTGSIGSVGTVKDTINGASGKTIITRTSTTTGETIFGTTDISKLVFTNSAQTVTAGSVSSIMTIQTQDATDARQNVTNNTTVNLASSSGAGKFYSDASGTLQITSVTITNGTNVASFYYKDTTAGAATITAAENPSAGWTDATQQVTVNPGAHSAFRITPNGSPTAGSPYALTITAVDQYSNTVTSVSGDHSFTFAGLATADDGTHPTITDKTPTAVNLGSATTITFSSGVSSAGGSLMAYKAESATLTGSDATSGKSTTDPGGTGASLTMANVNPVATTHSFTRAPSTSLKILQTNLLVGAADANHDNISLSSVQSASGDATVTAAGLYVFYSPGTNGDGATFTYTVSDGHSGTDTKTVTINVVKPGGIAQEISYNTGGVTIRFAGIPGISYDVQRSATSDFATLSTQLTTNAPTAGVFSYTDSSPLNPTSFYRLMQH